jgi:DNA phosphorothioation-associated putative methyltransferase
LAFSDGVLTGLDTFQTFYTQGEPKAYLETELSAEAIPASLGIFYVFKDETLQQQYLANRYRRQVATPRRRISELRFEEHRVVLEPFMATIAELGRLPILALCLFPYPRWNLATAFRAGYLSRARFIW